MTEPSADADTKAEIDALNSRLENDLEVILLNVLQQACDISMPDEIDSMAMSAYEWAVTALERRGYVECLGGGRIIGVLTQKAKDAIAAWDEDWDRYHRLCAERK